MDRYRQMAREFRRSSHLIALTGAGISVESGIPDFRSQGGLWTKYDPMEYGHIESFRAEPERVWEMLLEMDALFSNAQPNPAHFALAELERRGILKNIITQNVDSLHQRAGSRNVIEFHGHNRTLRCDTCGQCFPRETVSLAILPPRCPCGGPLRPDFVFFGESIPTGPHDEAVAQTQCCDMMIVVGTSVSVTPASYLPYLARVRGAYILEINPTQSEFSDRMCDFCIAEPAGEALPAILAALDELEASCKVTE
jgi:NAD-dependent deacetylase